MPSNYEQNHLYRTPAPSGGTTGFEAAKSSDNDKPTVRTPSLDHQRLAPYWQDVAAVRGGTIAMREAGETYLPMEPGEDADAYDRRLRRATLTPIYTRLVRAFASMILRKPVRVENTGGLSNADFRVIAGFRPGQDDPGEPVTGHVENLDRQGSDLQQFAFDWLCEAIHYGHAAVEVIYPRADEIATRADEVALGLRPHWSLYSAPQLLGKRGQQKIERVRLLQSVTEPEGEWGERLLEQVMVYRLDASAATWEIYREGEKENEWASYDNGELEMTGDAEIPIVFLYSDRKGQAVPPPMIEVLHLNIRHYQVSADMDNSLHVAAVPRLFFFGCNADDLGSVGSVSEAVCIPKPEARAEWSAPNPAAFTPNFERLQNLATEMMQLGLSTMTLQKNVGESAESKRLDRNQGDSQLAILAQNLQHSLDQCLRLHCAFLGIDPKQAPTTVVNRDFDLMTMTPEMVKALTGVVNAHALSGRTFLELLQQGEVGFSDEWSPDLELQRLADEEAEQGVPRDDDPELPLPAIAADEEE